MSDEKKLRDSKANHEPQPEKPKMRQIIIETDGNSVRIIKNESAGTFEFTAILQGLLNRFNAKR